MEEKSAEAFCRDLLTHGDLASKLRRPRGEDGRLLPFASEGRTNVQALDIERPAREPGLSMSKGAERLPALGTLANPRARIDCLRRFAHHELQAIELFAWAVLRFPMLPEALRRGFLLILEEEQQHLGLYLERLQAHGATLLGAPLSDYLWQHRTSIEAADDPPLAFLCALGLTFEQANLDFASLYRDAFRDAGDGETAAVLARIHEDEVRHVRLAVRWLRRLKAKDETDLAAYLRAVPFPLCLSRAKGRRFDVAARRRAGLDDDFIAQVADAEPYKKPTAEAPGREKLWLLPNLGAEESPLTEKALPASARGFLRGLYGAWAALFAGGDAAPRLLPPGDKEAQAAWQAALFAHAKSTEELPALFGLDELTSAGGMLAWLNVPAAALTAASHRLPLRGPPPEVVLALNDKAYAQTESAALGLVPDCLRGLCRSFSAAECQAPDAINAQLLSLVATWPAWTGFRFVVKPRLGTSGRGRLFGRLDVTAAHPVLEPRISEASWRRLAECGGCIVEPWLNRICDLSTQLLIHREQVVILGTTTQLVTPSGQILGNRGILDESGKLRAGPNSEFAASTEAALHAAAEQLGRAAAQRGFFGIAGVDAFVFRGPDETPVLRPVVELNARFTTGTVALGLVRRLAAAKKMPCPGAWALHLKAPKPEGTEPLGVPSGATCLCPLPRGPALFYAPLP